MPKEDTEIMNRYDDYTVEELREELQRFFLYSDLDDEAVDEMEKILAVLREKAPFEHPHTTEEMWAKFKAEHAEELSNLGIPKNVDTEGVIVRDPEEAADAGAAVVVPITGVEKVQAVSAGAEPRHGKRSQKLIRTALIAAAVVAVMVIITVSAAAAGINLWGWVPVWNDSTFRYVPEETAFRTSLDIPSALKSIGVDEPLFPTWLPDGFLIDEQQIQMDDPAYFFISYLNKDRILMIVITSIIDTPGLGTTEKDELEPILYTHSGYNHFIFSNLDKVVATFQNDSFIVRISGDISIEEMKKIIDSIYEE